MLMELSNSKSKSKYPDSRGRPRLRFKDVAKRNKKWRSINLSSWQQAADNRVAWRTATKFKPNP